MTRIKNNALNRISLGEKSQEKRHSTVRPCVKGELDPVAKATVPVVEEVDNECDCYGRMEIEPLLLCLPALWPFIFIFLSI